MSYIVAALTICKRMVCHIEVTKEASKDVGKIPIIVIYPGAQPFCIFGFLIVCAIIIIYLATSGSLM